MPPGHRWLDTGKRDWSDDLLAATGLDRSQMPKLVEGSEVSGICARRCRRAGACPRAWSWRAAAATMRPRAWASAWCGPGEAFVSLGTSGVLFAANDGYQPDPDTAVHTFCHALPDTWHQMGVILAATDALNWYARLIGTDAARLTGELGELQAPGKTLFLPYLGGERTPLNSAFGPRRLHRPGTCHRPQGRHPAVLEGVTFAIRDSRDALAATGTRLESLLAVGGGSRSDYWLRLIATALNCPCNCPSRAISAGPSGRPGWRLMAATGAGAEIATLPPSPAPSTPTRPDRAFDAGHARFRAAQSAIKDLT
jgi:xylulokinase